MCTDMCVDLCMEMCTDVCMNMSMHMCMDMCMDMCMHMCVDMCTDMRHENMSKRIADKVLLHDVGEADGSIEFQPGNIARPPHYDVGPYLYRPWLYRATTIQGPNYVGP